MRISFLKVTLVMLLAYSAFGTWNMVSQSKDLRSITNELNELKQATSDIQSDVTEIQTDLMPQLAFKITERAKKLGMDTMTSEQKQLLTTVYTKTAGTGYQLTLTAIAWKESRGNIWPVNVNDPSCGVFHTKITNVMKRESIEDSAFRRNVVCAKLMDDLDFAIKHAMLELDFWDKKYRGDWRKIWASYNGGHSGNKTYGKEISEIISVLRQSNLHLIELGMQES